MILLDAHPRTLIQLVIQTLAAPAAPSDFLTPSFSEDSGTEEEAKAGPSRVRALGPDRAAEAAEKAGAINAAMMALLDAGIPMRATVAACSCVVLRPKDANRLRPKNGAAGMRAGEPDMVEDVDMDGDDRFVADYEPLACVSSYANGVSPCLLVMPQPNEVNNTSRPNTC